MKAKRQTKRTHSNEQILELLEVAYNQLLDENEKKPIPAARRRKHSTAYNVFVIALIVSALLFFMNAMS